MAKNGLLNRLQRRLLLLAAANPSSAPGQLADLVARAVRTREPGQDPATRTFQALRIHVNRELEEVSVMLPQAGAPCAAGPRLAVISFHSLEDRIVKRFLQSQARPEVPRLPLRASEMPQPVLRIVGRAQRASPEETTRNPRARSAIPPGRRAHRGPLIHESSPARGGETEPPPPRGSRRLRARARHFAAQGRRAFSQLEREQAASRELEAEFGRLQLEASTWSLHSRVERLATRSLGLRAGRPAARAPHRADAGR